MFLVSKNHLHWLINPPFSRCWISDISPIKLDWCLLNSEKGKSSLAPPWFLLGKRKQLKCRSGARLEWARYPGFPEEAGLYGKGHLQTYLAPPSFCCGFQN